MSSYYIKKNLCVRGINLVLPSTFCFLLLFFTCPLLGQQQKRSLLTSDYHLWSSIYNSAISPNGDWLSYSLEYENLADTLFVKSTKTQHTYTFPNVQNGSFLSKDYFVCRSADSILHYTDLNKDKEILLHSVTKFEIAGKTGMVVCQQGGDKLLLINEQGRTVLQMDSIRSWNLSPIGDQISVAVQNKEGFQIELIDVKSLKQHVVFSDRDGSTTVMEWGEDNIGLAFTTGRGTIGYYNKRTNKTLLFEPSSFSDFPKDFTMDGSGLQISKDGERIFFFITPPHEGKKEGSNEIQIWNSGDKRLYPKRKRIYDWQSIPKLVCWWPVQNRLIKVSDNEMPYVALNGSQEYALLWNTLTREPQDKKEADLDIYCLDLKKNKKSKIIEEQSGNMFHMLASPNGRFLAYFKHGDWYLYNYKENKHLNITNSPQINAAVRSFGVLDELSPTEMLYFDVSENSVIITDEYDIWKVAIDGKAERLTFGREKNTRYRIVTSQISKRMSNRYSGLIAGVIDVKVPILVSVTNIETFESGFAMLQPAGKVQIIGSGAVHYSQIVQSETKKSFSYIIESYSIPPALMFQKGISSQPLSIVTTNQQYQHFKWGTVRVITYMTAKGKMLKGLLYYPSEYQVGRKYPLVVNVYEKQSQNYFRYINPSYYEPSGFNVSNFVARGYMVFLPDTEAELGYTGQSAVECVEAAVRKVIEMGVVDTDRIGLIGHSHGGFKVNFILTQSKIFKAAIASAGLTNLVSDYFTLSDIDIPQYWRYEHHQQRIGKSFYEDKEAYMRNSAILYADNITTPLFSWSGEEDHHVDYRQTMQFYFALRRLGKEHIMILYPKEGHILSIKENQEDISRRIFDWFDYYLKGKAVPDWMKPKM